MGLRAGGAPGTRAPRPRVYPAETSAQRPRSAGLLFKTVQSSLTRFQETRVNTGTQRRTAKGREGWVVQIPGRAAWYLAS